MPRCGIVIPIRLASERLPGKALTDVAGRPALHHLLDRAAASRFVAPKDVVVCTTREGSDDALVTAVEACGASVYRGETDDLIARFSGAVAAFGFEFVVEMDGDDLCCATEYVDLCFERLLADPATDVVVCEGLPLGIAPRGFTRQAMARVNYHYRSIENDTGFFHLFTKTGLCQVATVNPVSDTHLHDAARLTLDYEEDLEFFRALLTGLGTPGAPASLEAVIAHLRQHHELVEINRKMNDAFWQRTAEKVKLSYADAAGQIRSIGQ
ncbi:MAG: hypothetical protein CL569_01165 [Alphaproteobacteria bacterium]|nr:hypothetical protein [Alphaproteobacteria bacterium]|tara:strand:- start:572 stop:1375 length:804 start_codon:yes stop_codon:yes gene_type:complete